MVRERYTIWSDVRQAESRDLDQAIASRAPAELRRASKRMCSSEGHTHDWRQRCAVHCRTTEA